MMGGSTGALIGPRRYESGKVFLFKKSAPFPRWPPYSPPSCMSSPRSGNPANGFSGKPPTGFVRAFPYEIIDRA